MHPNSDFIRRIVLICGLVWAALVGAASAQALELSSRTPALPPNLSRTPGVAFAYGSDSIHYRLNQGNPGGSIIMGLPDPSRPWQPVLEFNSQFDFAFGGTPGSSPGRLSFNYGPPNDPGDPATGAGIGLSVVLNLPQSSDGLGTLGVFWQRQTITNIARLPLSPVNSPDWYSGCQVQLTNNLLTVQLIQQSGDVTTVLENHPVNWNPSPGWEFVFIGEGDPVQTPVIVSGIALTAWTAPFVQNGDPNRLPNRTSWQDFQDTFTFTIDSLESIQLANVVVTATSSDESVIPSGNLQITAPTANTRQLTMTPLARARGNAAVTLHLDAGGGLPVGTITYFHTVTPNQPPSITALIDDPDSVRIQNYPFPRSLPFSISSPRWPAASLKLTATVPPDLVRSNSYFFQPRDNSGTNWFFVFTPGAGDLSGAAQGPLTVKVTDGSGDSATSSFTLFTVSEDMGPVTLGSGTALALNRKGPGLIDQRQYAADTSASDTGFGATATIEAWVYATTLVDSNLNVIASAGRPEHTAGFILAVQKDGSPSMANWLNDFYPTNATVKITTNHWHHVAGVINGQAVTLYVDGKQSATGTLTSAPNIQAGPVYVGHEPLQDGIDRPWYGYLDNIRIWSTARSAKDIADNLTRAVASDAQGLVRDFRCDDGFFHFDGGNPGLASGGVPIGGSLQDSSFKERHAPIFGLPGFVPGVALTTSINVPEDGASVFGLGSIVDGTNVWGTAGITREIYLGPISATLADGLGRSQGWPNQPDVVLANGQGLEMPPGSRAGYGQRLRGYLLTPETGTYTFAIASANEGQLWISTDETAANLKDIASSPATGVSFRRFDFNPAQQTGRVSLTANRRYYFEVRHQADNGGNGSAHLSVQWTLPSGLLESPIPAYRVQPLGAPATPFRASQLTYVIDDLPDTGTLTVTNGRASFQPTANFFGLDTFTYRAAIGSITSAPVVVNLNVVSRDDAPVAGSGNALELNGGGLASRDSFSLEGDSFTVELWAKRRDTTPPVGSQLQTLWSLAPAQNGATASLSWHPDGHIAFALGGQSSTDPAPFATSVPYLDTNWHHWAATFSLPDRRVELFRDGISQGATNYTSPVIGVTNVQFFIGSLAGAASTRFNGTVDEVRLWTRMLTPDEIKAASEVPLVGNEDDLLVYYRLDEGNGLTANDSSSPKPGGTRLDASITDPVTWISGVTTFQFVQVPRNSPGQSIFLPGFDFDGDQLTYQILSATPANGRLIPNPARAGLYTYIPNQNYFGVDQVLYRVTANGQTSAVSTLDVAVVFAPIPPTISSLRDVEFEEEDPPLVLPITLSSVDDPTGTNLTLTATSTNPDLLPVDNILLEGAGNSRTVTLEPVDGAVGTASVRIQVSNGPLSASTEFQVRVNPRLKYVVVNAGAATGQQSSVAAALNENGQLAGWIASTISPTNSRPFFYTGYGAEAAAYTVNNLGGNVGAALGVNAAGLIVGAVSDNQAALHAFRIAPQQNTQPTDLGFLVGGNLSVATDINDNGLIVGYGQVGDSTFRAFTWNAGILTEIPIPNDYASMWATAVNAAGQMAGYAVTTSGTTNGFVSFAGQMQDLGRPSGATHVIVTDINAGGQVFGHALYSGGATSRIVRWDNGTWTEFEDPLGGGEAEVSGANRYGQIVGRALTTNGVWHAFLHDGGRAYDLNTLLAAGSEWTLTAAADINDRGQIAATGSVDDGPPQALLLFPATEIGRRVFRPEGTIAELPQITILQGGGSDQPGNAFYWSAVDRKLFAIRPVVAEIRWRTGTYEVVTNLTEFGDSVIRQKATNEISVPTLSFNVWPEDTDIHVVGSPVQVQPDQPGFQHGLLNLIYTTADGAQVDDATMTFTSPSLGYSVLHYLRTGGRAPNPDLQPHEFTVSRSVAWNDPRHVVTNVAWDITAPLTNALHNDYAGLNGFILFTNSPYDAVAHDRTNRTGPILTVNTDTEGGKLVVTWYRQNRIGVSWSELPYQYSLHWPTNTDTIVIASLKGSGDLSPAQFPQAQIYNQPDATLPGFNPNEEHALIVEGVLYALRSDLNSQVHPKASDPYVLLKYMDPASNEWRLKAYAVVDEQAPYFFRYEGVAGHEIQAPLPLSALPLMTAKNRVVFGPAWQDYHGKFYARAAGLDGGEGDVVLQYFYPLEPGFYYDLDRDGQPEYATGDPVPWLDLRPGGIVGDPVNINYAIDWPTDVPPLNVGQSLTSATGGLPDIGDMAAAQVVFDSLDPHGTNALSAVARLYDPLSARTVELDANFKFPDSIQRAVDPTTGLEFFPDLPYVLRVRFFHDPANRLLGFSGYVYAPVDGGASITLVNVMSSRERATIAALDDTGAGPFVDAVGALYLRTRNPNGVDADHDSKPDEGLLIGLTSQVVTNAGVITTNILRETLKGPKALSAGQPVPPISAAPAYAVHFGGTDGALAVGPVFTNVVDDFTIELWVRPETTLHPTTETDSGVEGTSAQPYAIFPTQGGTSYGSGHVGAGIAAGTNGISVFVHGDNLLPSLLVHTTALTGWHHVAVVFQQRQPLLFLDGALAKVGRASPRIVHPSADVSGIYGAFTGAVSDLRVWNYARTPTELEFNFNQRLTGEESGLIGLWRFDENQGTSVADASPAVHGGTLSGGTTWTTNAPPRAPAHRYVVVAENNDSTLGGLPVGLHVIRVDDTLARGALALITPDNVLDERVTLRHTADFAGQPESFVFQWYYQFDSTNFNAGDLPGVATDGSLTLGSWVPYSTGGSGINDITLGVGAESSLLTLSDTWWIMRYGVVTGVGRTNWSTWVGDPAGTEASPRAMLVPGWIKRVLGGINLFAQRSSDFLNNQVNTLASTIAEAGPRYEGDVALNPNVLDNFGLIEIYETVLRRGRSLSIDGTPPVDFAPADEALLLAAGSIADLYLLHANEAFADSADPTIGLTTDSTELGSVAASVFAFENQVDSLLEEELAMLRGRDDRSGGVGVPPVYNRLLWNFTGGDGEVAYVAKYGIPDQNGDGFLNALDARILFPQGHGDAWGHYLTALTTYYNLLRNPNFTWTPRAQSTLVAGIPIEVNYEDERRFALTAAAKARTGAEIVDRAWRLDFVDDPVAQFRGDYDPDPNRAWSATDWARRAALGAYFDWITGNAILPPLDTDPQHTGIQRVDRTTVPDLAQIVTEVAAVVATLDRADAGLNPDGLARGVVPFDIDPDQLRTGFSRVTHFEQIYQRAVQALQNAETTFNRATILSSELRKQQNSVSDFSVAVADQELDYKDQLIAIFGYPHAGNIGAGKPYPAGYDGPDLIYWSYIDTLDVTPQNNPRGDDFLDLDDTFKSLNVKGLAIDPAVAFSDDALSLLNPAPETVIQVDYPVSAGDYAFQALPEWRKRRAEGQLQANLRSLVLAQAQLRQGLAAYSYLIAQLEEQSDLLSLRFGLRDAQIQLMTDKEALLTSFNALILIAKGTQIILQGAADDIQEFNDAVLAGIPTVEGLSFDGLAAFRTAIHLSGKFFKTIPDLVVEGAEVSEAALEFSKEAAEIDIDKQGAIKELNYEVTEQLKQLEALLRQEPGLRLNLFNANQSILQAARNLEASLAEGQRILAERTVFRQVTAGSIQADRYRDLGLRIFRNDALQKYDAQFALAARYVHLAAAAYDYELNLGTDGGAVSTLGAQIVRERNLGELSDGEPVVGRVGLASLLGRMRENFDVLKGQLGLNNDRTERSRFSLRTEAFRILPTSTNDVSDASWRTLLQQAVVTNLWDVPEFRRYCRSFAPESAGPQRGLVLRFGTTIAAGRNFFDQALGPLDSSYDPSEYSTRIKSLAVWFSDYDAAGLSAKPRVYLVPLGADRLRATGADDFTVHDWQVQEQSIPVPHPITAADLVNAGSQPLLPAPDGSFTELRRHSAFRAYQDAAFDLDEFNESSRLVGRSVWNTQWVLIIPGAYLLGQAEDGEDGVDRFVNSVSDIKLYFQTYSSSGN